MGKKSQKRRSLLHRRRMKHRDRQDDIPDCPSIGSIELPEEETSEGCASLTPIHDQQEYSANVHEHPNADNRNTDFDYWRGNQTSGGADQSSGLGEFDDGKHSDELSYQYGWHDNKSPAYAHRRDRGAFMSKSIGKFIEVMSGLLLELFIHTAGMLQYALQYPTAFAIFLIICGTYLTFSYLETSLMACVELINSFLWPLLHILLRFVEHFFRNIGNIATSVDDLGHAFYCDTAHLWCSHFRLMCHNQCSYVSQALERMRNSRI